MNYYQCNMLRYYIDLGFFLQEIGRNTICEFAIFRVKNNIMVDIMHYHNKPKIDRYIVKTDKTIRIDTESKLTISSLHGLTVLKRLKIANMIHLDELPYFGDSLQLEKLILYNNGLVRLPRNISDTVNYLDCSQNKLKELTAILPSTLKYLYAENNNLLYLPTLPTSLILLIIGLNPLNNYIGRQYNLVRFQRKIFILLQFRWNYYFLKFGRRFLYFLLKKRMSKHKNTLLEMSAKISMNPARILRLLEIYDDLEDI